MSKGRFYHGNARAAKLDEATVIWILDRYFNRKWTQGRLARETRMSIGQIGRITRGECWQEVYDKYRPLSKERIEESHDAFLKSEGMVLEMPLIDPAASEPQAKEDTDRPDPIEEFLRKRSRKPREGDDK